MLTLKQARELQKEYETKAIFGFLAWIAAIVLISVLVFGYTDILEISNIFYLLPAILLVLAVKKTEIYMFFTPKEFSGRVISIDVYAVKTGKVRGEHSYEFRQGEAFEAEIIIKNDNGKTAVKTIYHSRVTASIGEGTKVAFLRFIYQPVIL